MYRVAIHNKIEAFHVKVAAQRDFLKEQRRDYARRRPALAERGSSNIEIINRAATVKSKAQKSQSKTDAVTAKGDSE